MYNIYMNLGDNNMPIIDAGPYQFNYDDNSSFEANFTLWAAVNTEEKIAHGEEPYSRKQQQEIFSKIYSQKA